MKLIRISLSALCASLPALAVLTVPLMSAPAVAQLEEVVVTARRRAESLQDTPISVSAVSASQLEDAGITALSDIKNIVPNMQVAPTATKSQAIFVRGIGQRASTPELDPGVGQYLNGIFIARQDSQLLDAVDVASIQILRGPQGTLFGKNNTGGAMLITTQLPESDRWLGSTTVTVGSHGRKDFKGSVNIPLIEDRVGWRLSTSVRRLDGYFENIVDGSMFADEDRRAVSSRLVWDVSENVSLDLFSFWSAQDEKGQGNNCEVINADAAAATFFIPEEPDVYAERCRDQENLPDDRKVAINTDRNASLYRQKAQLHAINLQWNLPVFVMESITAYSKQYALGKQEDIDGTDITLVHNGERLAQRALDASGIFPEDEERYQLSQEVKFNGRLFDDRLDLTFGAFYSFEQIDAFPYPQIIGKNGLLGIPPTFLSSLAPGAAPPGIDLVAAAANNSVLPLLSASANLSYIENETRAVFIQGSYDLNEQLQLTLGMRYTEDDKQREIVLYNADFEAFGRREGLVHAQGGIYNPVPRQTFDNIDYELPIPFLDPVSTEEKLSFEQFSPAFTATYMASDAVLDALAMDSFMVYLTLSEGYKSGGLGLRGRRLNTFEPEIVENSEIGFKFDALDSRWRLNGAIYRMDYDQIQVQQAETGPGGPTDVILFLDNAGSAIVQGAELETTLALDKLLINASLGYTDAYYNEYTVFLADGSQFDRSNEPFAVVPKHTRALSIQYRLETPLGLVIPRLSYSYRSEIFVGLDAKADLYEGATLGGQELYNARVTWLPSDRWRVAAYVNNIKDSVYFGGGVALGDNLGTTTKAQLPPRHFGVEVAYQWE
ncbi:outer membrane receptor protein involved in Fe transport [Litorivivens lipolytica]|uniref:Outer membrane receptor protein involved in Fe transport n=1 Tax=Litorivivens lipolytica TaxID=1524264 RepID=A0A7W4Z7N2_9GAMM|nr:outer membrane receptor protein involved in Fe transport [Litorivivens lipolytica]